MNTYIGGFIMYTFSNLKIGEYFYFGGNKWLKRSTRTALLLYCNRIFYFGKNEYCKKGEK